MLAAFNFLLVFYNVVLIKSMITFVKVFINFNFLEWLEFNKIIACVMKIIMYFLFSLILIQCIFLNVFLFMMLVYQIINMKLILITEIAYLI